MSEISEYCQVEEGKDHLHIKLLMTTRTICILYYLSQCTVLDLLFEK